MISRTSCPRRRTFVVTSDDERLNGIPGNDEYDLIDDVPSVTVCLAPDWCSVIIGALEKFYDDDLWGPDADPYFYQQQLDKLVVALSQEPTFDDCVDCVPDINVLTCPNNSYYAWYRYDDGTATFHNFGLWGGIGIKHITTTYSGLYRFEVEFYADYLHNYATRALVCSVVLDGFSDAGSGSTYYVDVNGDTVEGVIPELTFASRVVLVSSTSFDVTFDW